MSNTKIKILQTIHKNVHSKNWLCLHPNCNQVAIKSHILQKNGILNQISENSHVIELVENDYFKVAKGESTLIFKKNSINKVMSHPLFCNSHDTSLFKKIELGEIDFYDKVSQILFSYRTVCSELWKKQRNLEFYNRLKNSSLLKTELLNEEQKQIQQMIESHSLGINDLLNYKSKLEKATVDTSLFTFKTFKLPRLEICASGVFSPVTHEERFDQEDPFPAVFINLIPKNNSLYFIIGRSNQYTNNWIEDYLNIWENSYLSNFEHLVSDLLASRMESWAISPSLFENWKPTKLKKIEDYWNRNRYNLFANQKFSTNFFSKKI